jgi:hypothetical protein
VSETVSAVPSQLVHVPVGETTRGNWGGAPSRAPSRLSPTPGTEGAMTVETFSPTAAHRLAGAVASRGAVWQEPADLAREAYADLRCVTGPQEGAGA